MPTGRPGSTSPCILCRSDQRDDVEALIVAGEAYERIAGRFDIPPTRVRNHAARCLAVVRGHRACMVCSSPESRRIEMMAVSGARQRDMASQMGCSTSMLEHHLRRHVGLSPRSLVAGLRCAICQHPRRAAIEADSRRIGRWAPETSFVVAARYGVSRETVLRHRRLHLDNVEHDVRLALFEIERLGAVRAAS